MRLLMVSLLVAAFATAKPLAAEEFPIAHFVKRPEIQSLTISPDGLHAAAVVPIGEQKVVAVLDLSNLLKVQVLKTFSPPAHSDAWAITWLNNERIMFTTVEEQTSLTSPRGTGMYYAVNIDGKKKINLAGRDTKLPFMGGVLDRMEDDPKHVIVRSAHGGDRKLRVETLDVYSGKTRLIGWTPMRATFGVVLDADQQPRFAVGQEPDEYEQTVKYRDADGDWEAFEHPFVNGDVTVYGMSEDNKIAWLSSTDKERFGLYSYNIDTKEFKQLLTDEVAEVTGVIWDRKQKEIIGAMFMPDYPVMKYINPDHPDALLREQLASNFPGQLVRFTSFSFAGTRATVQVSSDVNPGHFYVLDFPTNQLIPVGPALPWVDPETMSEMKPFQVTVRDGTVIHGYLTYPKGEDPSNLPMIVHVHGGPHGPRDRWGWDGRTQLMANRGYLVMQVNYRGSGGYSKQFEKSGYQKWGTEMQDDLTDATLWAIDQGLADKNKVCIYGASYGGYATLAGITREPDLYACAFAFVGVYDLELMRKSGDIARRKSGMKYLDDALGTDPADLQARSPISHVSKIKTPLYVAHGKKDDRADVKNYYALVDELEKHNIPFERLLTDKEAHGFWDLSNQELLYGEMLTFFAKYLKPGDGDDGSVSAIEDDANRGEDRRDLP